MKYALPTYTYILILASKLAKIIKKPFIMLTITIVNCMVTMANLIAQ